MNYHSKQEIVIDLVSGGTGLLTAASYSHFGGYPGFWTIVVIHCLAAAITRGLLWLRYNT